MKILPYIYEPDKSLEVYKKTEEYFIENPSIKTEIEELGWIYQTIGMIIPQNWDNLWSGHFFPHIESWEELQISFNLICFGLYKQAFVSIRSGLELGILSVYYNINDDGHNTVKAWLNSKRTNDANTPRTEKIWQILLSNENIKKFNAKHNLRASFDALSYLHNFVHTKGIKYSNRMPPRNTNSQTFEPELIAKWLKSYKDIITIIATLHLLKYPVSVMRFDYSKKFGIDIPSFGGLEEWHIDQIAKILPKDYLSDIEEIANNDPQTQDILADINSLPDMTDEQIETQIINLAKMTIEHGSGFNKWLDDQKRLYSVNEETEFSDTMKTRIKVLREWASANDLLEFDLNKFLGRSSTK